MTELAFIDVVGYWLGIFLTFCILSFLYKDNPFYKLAEHIFIGISIGYVITQQYANVLEPKLIEPLSTTWGTTIPFLLALAPIALVAMLFIKAVSTRWAWLGRYPLAFVVAFYAGLQINGVAQADLGQQIKRATQNLDALQVNVNRADVEQLATLPGVSPAVAEQIVVRRAQQPFASIDEVATMEELSAADRAILDRSRGPLLGLDARAAVEDGQRWWFGIVSDVLLLLGLLAALVYFYFSVAHKGVVGHVSRVGVWVLMIGFGASFGYTVQGRISLAIGRAQEVMGHTMDEQMASQVKGPVVALVSILVIVAGIVVWELRNRRREPGESAGR